MTIVTKSGLKFDFAFDGTVLTRDTPKGTLLVEIRDMEGKTVGLFLDPQAIIP